MAMLSVEKITEDAISKIIRDMGYVLYDIEYVKEGKEYHLYIYIDSDKGIGIDDCEKVTNAINPILDELDIIKDQYFLEVSSCGLERKLKKKWHYEKQIGNKIRVYLFKKVQESREYTGVLREYNDDFLRIECDNGNWIKIDIDNIATAKTFYEWYKK